MSMGYRSCIKFLQFSLGWFLLLSTCTSSCSCCCCCWWWWWRCWSAWLAGLSSCWDWSLDSGGTCRCGWRTFSGWLVLLSCSHQHDRHQSAHNVPYSHWQKKPALLGFSSSAFMIDPGKILPTPSLITIQNLVTVSHTQCPHTSKRS